MNNTTTFINFSRFFLKWFLCCFVTCIPLFADAQQRLPVLTVKDSILHYPVTPYVEILEDPGRQLSFEQVSSAGMNTHFRWVAGDKLNMGFTSSAYWLRFRIANHSHTLPNWLLVIGYPALDDLQLYRPKNGEWEKVQSGDALPFRMREVKHRNCIFLVDLPQDSSKVVTYYLRVASSSSMQIPLTLMSYQYFYDIDHDEQFYFGILYGILVVMMLYNLFLYISLVDKVYLYYVLSLISITLVSTGVNGYSSEYLVPDSPRLVTMIVPLAIFSYGIWAKGMSVRFLELNTYAPKLHRVFKALEIFCVMAVVATLLLPYAYVGRVMVVMAMVIVVIMMIAGILRWRDGYAPAAYYTLARLVLILGVFLYGFKTFGLLPSNFITDHFFEVGIVAEVTLLAMALGYRVRLLKLENKRSQRDALHAQQEATLKLEERVKQRTHQLEFAYEEIMIKNQNITDSIRYAERIQRAIFPGVHEVMNEFKEAFIFFSPRDFVSGDFYWFTIVEPRPVFVRDPDYFNGDEVFRGYTPRKKIIAAVDCTGHGVPGAFMTVIANSLLNSIVIEHHITDPSLILSELDKKVIEGFHHGDRAQTIHDGMDIAILVIDEENHEIEYAGARNPLYYVQQGEFKQIKASRQSIGNDDYRGTKVFEKHTIKYGKGDTFYIFSDGYQDQFGGEADKKFTVRRFRELLQQVNPLSMQEQYEQLRKVFNDWRGDCRQTDDVIVMGIRM